MVAAMGGSLNGSDDGRGEGEAETPASDVVEKNYDRDLGVIEAITVVTRSCPNGGVTSAAKQALEAVKAGGPETLKEQAYFVLTAIKGWRGERARQVHRSLSRYLDQGTTDNDPRDPTAPREEDD
jgi:hypothetical protein